MSEKITDMFMLNAYNKVFNRYYHTESNKKLFSSFIPDGWDIINAHANKPILLIIENKKEYKREAIKEALMQLVKYYKCIPDDVKQQHEIYLIVGVGDNKNIFTYCVYDSKLQRTKLTFEDIKKKTQQITTLITNPAKVIHDINQIIYNELTLQKQQKTLFISSILICLKIDENFLVNYGNDTIADKIIETIDNYYQDKAFTNIFKFMSKTIKNSSIKPITQRIITIMKTFNGDLLNSFYHEFCQYDKNDDKKYGIVLTPEDIVKLMVKELNINENDKVLDFCCGTGSFIIECGHYTKNLYACESSDERYAIAKCNFILNDYPTNNLVYSSCFNYPYATNSFDKVIINPPFALDCQDDENINNNSLHWTNFTKEQRFVIYAIELLKPGGIACVIIPRSNIDVNGRDKQRALFKRRILETCNVLKTYTCNPKVFYPVASVECSILVLQKLSQPREITNGFTTNLLTIDYSNDGYTTNKNIRYKQSEANPIEIQKQITTICSWNYEAVINDTIDANELEQMIIEYQIDYEASMKKLFFRQRQPPLITPSFKQYKLTDIAQPLVVKTFQTNKAQHGDIPLYGCSTLNNPVKFIDSFTIDTNTHEDPLVNKYGVLCVNKTGDGGAGYCFVRYGKFAINPSVFVCKLFIPISNTNACFLSHQLHKIYSRGNSLNIDKFNTQQVNLIENDGEYTKLTANVEQRENEQLLTTANLVAPIFPTIDKNTTFTTYKLSDILQIVKPIKMFCVRKTQLGNIPLISSTSTNNGIVKFINDFSVNMDENYLTIARTGSAGYCFVQSGKIGITESIKVCKLLDNNMNIHLLAILITRKFTKKYSYCNGLTFDKIMNETISYPCVC